jgi:hypothetical protein
VRRQVVELARAGTRVAQLAETFGMTVATIYNWLNQEKIDRGEIVGQTTGPALELAAAKRRIRELETELAVSRKVNEVFRDQDLAPKASTPAIESLTGQGIKVRHAGRRAWRVGVGLLHREGPAAVSDGAAAALAGWRDH